MTEARLGIGTKVAYETTIGASPLAFTDVKEVLDVPPLNFSREFVEATNQDSEGETREYIGGLIDAEEITIQANYLANDPTHRAIYDMFRAKTARMWQVRETTESPVVIWQGLAVVSSYGPGMPVADKKVLEFKLRRTGNWERL